ncbi:MPPD2 Metallophosphoesterase, partial [Polypterus senegalus]
MSACASMWHAFVELEKSPDELKPQYNTQLEVFEHTEEFCHCLYRVDPIPYDTPKPAGHTRFVCVSDTHSRTDGIQMPYGDVLLHTGDLTELGLPSEVKKFNDWLGNLPYEFKIVIAGNHELTFDKDFMADLVKQDYYRFPSVSKLKPEDFDNVQSLLSNCLYLQDSEVTVKGFRIYGTPCYSTEPMEFIDLDQELHTSRDTTGIAFGTSGAVFPAPPVVVPDDLAV